MKLAAPTATARRAAGDELERVATAHHAAHADERDAGERLGDLGHHAQGDRLDRRAAEPAGAVAEERPQGRRVEHHRLERVDQGEAVGAGLDGGRGRPGARR